MASPKPAKAPAATKLNPLGDLADELGALEARIDWKAVTRVDAIRRKLRDETANAPAAEAVRIAGKTHAVTLAPCGIQQIVHTAAAFKLLGVAKFRAIAKLTLTALREHLSGEQVETCIVRVQNGPRTITVAEIAPSRA